MCNAFVRTALALSVSLALASGSALAKISKESKKPGPKTVAVKKVSSSKEAAARQARLKKIGSATPKGQPKVTQPKKAAKPTTTSAKKNHTAPARNQIARTSDGGSVAERRARIHSMQVPE
jgi:hypothetical protein